ncbi:hypothetical protein [Streptomyces anulatus]|uniref:hypothetical protein n=1 Tax=Streptomyces anulatus TaxID=1892 RepID=UPI0033D054EB
MLAAIGPAPSGILCADCGTELLRTSRSWKPPARYGPPLCPDGLSLERDARSRTWRVASLRSRIVAQAGVQARAMDWRAAAELVLAFPPLSQGVCRGSTADQQEGVWRGWENARVIRNRLIASAAAGGDNVRVTVDEAQLLVDTALRVADWDTARTRDIVNPITHEPALALLTRLRREVRATAEAARERADAAYPEGYELSEDEESEAWRGIGGGRADARGAPAPHAPTTAAAAAAWWAPRRSPWRSAGCLPPAVGQLAERRRRGEVHPPGLDQRPTRRA